MCDIKPIQDKLDLLEAELTKEEVGSHQHTLTLGKIEGIELIISILNK